MKDSNGLTGRGRSSTPFYDELDAILGTRAASCPPVVLDSGGNSGQSDGNEENGGRLDHGNEVHGNEVEASVTHANPEEGGNLVKYEM